jgi:predicted nucleotidyltransferase
MNKAPLDRRAFALIQEVFLRHPEISDVTLFGSRAKGTHAHNSDIDLSVRGRLGPLQTEALAAELDELPLPYQFDILDADQVSSEPLLEHIKRVGIVVYRSART